MTSRFQVLMIALSLSGCMGFKTSLQEEVKPVAGGSVIASGTGGSSSNAKSLWSLWTSSSNGATLDLRQFRSPATQKLKFEFSDGAVCECGLISSRDGDVLTVAQCKKTSVDDPGCSAFDDQYTLSLQNEVLSVCDPYRNCNTYR